MPCVMVPLLILTLALASRASAAECPAPVPTEPGGNYIVPGTLGGIVYRDVEGRRLLLDAFTPPNAGRQVAVIVIHGGGYVAGSRVSFVGQLLELLGDASIPFFSIEYRLGGPEQRDQSVDDVRAAVAFVRCRADSFGIDADRIVVLGEDTGAEMALALLDGRTPGVIAAALLGSRFGLTLDTASRAHGAVLAVHGTEDREQPIDTLRTMCAGRTKQGRGCEVVPVEGAIHRAENWRPSQWGYKAPLLAWLRQRGSSGGQPEPERAGSSGSRATALPHRFAPGLHKRVVFDPVRALVLDAWLPRGPGKAPAVILVHGGGWEAGDRVTYIAPLFAPLARAGFAWFSIDYRLTPDVRHPEQVDDVRRAVAFVRQHADRFGVDAGRLGVVGESASGQMAMLLAVEDRALAGVVSFYGVYDFAPMVTDAGPRSLLTRLFGHTVLDERARADLRQYSPLHRAREGMPPLLLIHGTGEGLWAQGQAMAERLAAIGVPHEMLALAGAPHGMENWEGRPEWADYTTRLVSWLRARFSSR